MSKQVNWLKRLQLLLKALEKNGVKTAVWVELETKISGYELDFFEHDKVFEDKIANLENQIAYMKEKKNYLRTRCMEDATDAFDSGAYGRLTIVGRRVDLETENEKLKQRIAELESKENEKTMRIEFHSDNGELFTPLEVANSLINQTTFEVDELRELAEHLQVYCRHHNDREKDVISF